MTENLSKKAEKKGVRIGCKVILDGDTTHVYTVRNMYPGTDENGKNQLRVYLKTKGCSMSWNANSSRLTVYEESDSNAKDD